MNEFHLQPNDTLKLCLPFLFFSFVCVCVCVYVCVCVFMCLPFRLNLTLKHKVVSTIMLY